MKTTNSILRAGALATIALVFAATAEASVRRLPSVTVAEGETASIEAKTAVSLVSANSAIVGVTPPDGGSAVLSGIRLGQTEIIYADQSGPFAVRPVVVVPTYWDMLKKFFEDDPEVTIGVVGDKVVIAGQTANVDTLHKLDEARNLDGSRLVVQVNYAAEALGVLVRDYLCNTGVSNVTVKVVGHEVCLSGRMFDKQSITRIDQRVREFLKDFPGISVNSDGLHIYKQKILIGIEFISYDVTRMKNLGLQLPDSIIASWNGTMDYANTFEPGGETRNASAGFSISDFKTTINIAKENKAAKRLYSTTLSTQSGEPAVFQSGGTIHKIENANTYSTNTKEIEYGFIIKTMPIIVDVNTVNLEFELDHKTPQNTSENGKDLDVSRYQTKSRYVVRPGESIVLSGFNKATDDTVKRGTPWLSKIPLIGKWLFGNNASTISDEEMLLIVTIDWSFDDETANAKIRRERIQSKTTDIEMP